MHDFFSNFCVCKSTFNIDTKTKVDIKIFATLEDSKFYMNKLYVDQKEKLSDLSHKSDLISDSEFNEFINTNITKYRVCKFQSQEKQTKACEKKCVSDLNF